MSYTHNCSKIIVLFQRNNLWVAVNDNFAFVPAERFMQIAAQGVPLEHLPNSNGLHPSPTYIAPSGLISVAWCLTSHLHPVIDSLLYQTI
jgi:hypothetical protein